MTFNPIKEEKEGTRSQRVVWTTEALEKAVKGLNQGRVLSVNPFYDNKVWLLKEDLTYQRTPEEIKEWKKCSKDVLYFAQKYAKLLTPEGIKHVTLRDYQVEYLKFLSENRLTIFLSARQSGKTTTSALFMLWYILFNVDKGALVLGDKRATAVEILDKMKKIFRELPYFLKPGVVKWNEGEISFDNGCRIMAQATTQNSGISFTFHCVLADEFAHVDPNMVRKFYSQIFPTVTASKAKFMITSTQNGRNLFYKLYKAAEAHESDYAAFKVDWWQIPEWDPTNHKWIPRDDEWKAKQIANLGSEEDFNMQFGTDFDIGAPTLLNQKYIKSLETPAFIYKDMLGVTSSSSWYWHPDLDIYDLKNMKLVVTSDLAEQVGQDYTIFEVYRLVNPLAGVKGKLQLMGYFRDNTSSREVCAQSLVEFLNKYTDSDATIVSFEKNTYGDIFYRDVKDFCDDHDIEYPRFVKYATTGSNKKNPGIKITPGNKSDHCKLFKEAFEKGQIQCNCEQWILESYNFVEDNGSYKASYGHDDLMMAAIQLTFVEESTEYTVLLDQPDPVEAHNQALLEDKEYIDNPVDSRFKGQIIARNIVSSADRIHNSSWIQGRVLGRDYMSSSS